MNRIEQARARKVANDAEVDWRIERVRWMQQQTIIAMTDDEVYIANELLARLLKDGAVKAKQIE